MSLPFLDAGFICGGNGGGNVHHHHHPFHHHQQQQHLPLIPTTTTNVRPVSALAATDTMQQQQSSQQQQSGATTSRRDLVGVTPQHMFVTAPRAHRTSSVGPFVQLLVDHTGEFGGGLIIRNQLPTRFVAPFPATQGVRFMEFIGPQTPVMHTCAHDHPAPPSVRAMVANSPGVHVADNTLPAPAHPTFQHAHAHASVLRPALHCKFRGSMQVAPRAIRISSSAMTLEQTFTIALSARLDSLLLWCCAFGEDGDDDARVLLSVYTSPPPPPPPPASANRAVIADTHSVLLPENPRVRQVCGNMVYRIPATTTITETSPVNTPLPMSLVRLPLHPAWADPDDHDVGARMRTVIRNETVHIQLTNLTPQRLVLFMYPTRNAPGLVPSSSFPTPPPLAAATADIPRPDGTWPCVARLHSAHMPPQLATTTTSSTTTSSTTTTSTTQQQQRWDAVHAAFGIRPSSTSTTEQQHVTSAAAAAVVAARVERTTYGVAVPEDLPYGLLAVDVCGAPLAQDDVPVMQWTPHSALRIVS